MQAELLDPVASAQWRQRLLCVAPGLLLAGSRCGAVALQFLLQIVVGSMAGAAGLGVLQLFTSWSCMIGEGLARGLPAWAMRVVAVDASQGDVANTRENLNWAVRRIVRLVAVLGLIPALALALLDPWLYGDYRRIALAVILGAPLFALLRLGAEALKGLGQALVAVTIENLAMPGFLLFVCIGCCLGGQTLDLALLLCAGVGGFSIALWAVWKAMAVQLPSVLRTRSDTPACLPDRSDINALWANSALAVAFLQLPFLLMPWFATPQEIGIYAVAHKMINVVTTLLILLSAVFGPAFARAAASEGVQTLRRMLRRTQWLSCVIFLPLVFALLLAIDPLAILFNVPPESLGRYMMILAAGQLVNAATGLSGVLLNMSGGAVLETRTLAAAVATAVLAAPVVGAAHGALGLAVLFSVVLAGKNLASYLAVSVFLSQEDVLS